jgi:hypothetical protein
MLDRAALVVALVRHRRDDALLVVAPPDPADAAPSRSRERAPSAATSSAALASALGEFGDDAVGLRLEAGDAGRAQLDAVSPARPDQRGEQRAVLDHVGEGLAGLDLAREGQKGLANGVGETAVGDHHVQDRLRLRLDLAPGAERGQHFSRASGDRVGAAVVARVAGQRRVADRDLHAGRQGLLQGERQRKPCDAAAGDEDAPGWGSSMRVSHSDLA